LNQSRYGFPVGWHSINVYPPGVVETKQRADFLILGAGVVGLAIATELKRRRPSSEIVIVEKEPSVALHSSGRNSGVVHAGFYYTPDSLKARFTAEGNRRLRDFCSANGIVTNAAGKVVVARTEAEVIQLSELARRGTIAGSGTRLIDSKELLELDPNARTLEKALYSPNTVTVNPREVCGALESKLRSNGVKFFLECGYKSRLGKDAVQAGKFKVEYGHLVNCAGLYADHIARDFSFSSRYTILPFKGIYLVNHARERNTRINIYPTPNPNNPFLGVHFTLTADGHEKIGPTAIPAFWRENYQGFSRFKLKELFEVLKIEGNLFLTNKFRFRDLAMQEIQKYIKANLLREAASLVKTFRSDGDWRWGKPGIRAQLIDLETMALVQDFLVEGDSASTHVLNAVSPAFTSAFPFADYVVDRVLGPFSVKQEG
jgi:(S)-2-hydroxyglutarate dehydrogenase